MTDFLRIVLAGGPASGKTETWRELSREFPELFAVPEGATLLIDSLGLQLDFDTLHGHEFKQAFWYACWRIQELAERLADAQARVLGKRGVLLDRALADHAAYLENGRDDFFVATGLHFVEVFRRYDLVVFLGSPESSEQLERASRRKNGPVRLEGSFEENRQQAQKTLVLWQEHPAFRFVPYLEDFNDKLSQVRLLVRGLLYPSVS
jgi:predicted ATPase